MRVQDSKGQFVELEFTGYGDDIQVTSAEYVDVYDTYVSDSELDWILEAYAEDIVLEGYERAIERAEHLADLAADR